MNKHEIRRNFDRLLDLWTYGYRTFAETVEAYNELLTTHGCEWFWENVIKHLTEARKVQMNYLDKKMEQEVDWDLLERQGA